MKDWNIDSSWTLFLDRDGVFNVQRENDYVKTPEEWVWIDGVQESLKYLTRFFNRTVIITNQQGIGKGIMNEVDLALIHIQLFNDLKKMDVKLDGILYAPYLAAENHEWRKPKPGMILEASRQYADIQLGKSIFVGDSFSDNAAGKAAGCKTVFLNKGKTVQCDTNITDFQELNLPSFTSYLRNL